MKKIFSFVLLSCLAGIVIAQKHFFDESVPALQATRVISEKNQTLKGETLSASAADTSVLLVQDGASATATKTTFAKNGGNTSDDGQSNFYGLNGAVVAQGGSSLSLQGVTVASDADGANAVVSTGNGTVVTAKNIAIHTKQNSSRGLHATYGGTIVADNVDVTTEGAHCAAFATDRGEGTVTVNGGKAATAGEGSPVIYSTGAIAVKNLVGKATGSEMAVIEGKNSITLEKVTLTGGTKNGRETGCGIMLYQSMSGDADEGTSVFDAKNSVLNSTSDGSFFYVTNTNAVIKLQNTVLAQTGSILLRASGNNSERGWGKRGANGGTVTLTTTKQKLTGDIETDGISVISLDFANGTNFTGAINTQNAGTVNLTLAKGAKLTLTADSYVNELVLADDSYKNIISNGHALYYNKNAQANSVLKGRTILLNDGGKLVAADVQTSSQNETKSSGEKIPMPPRDKNAPNAKDRNGRPQMELTTLSGKLTYTGKTDNAATLNGSDGKGTVLKVMDRPAMNGGKPDRPPMPNGNGNRQGIPPQSDGKMQPPQMGGNGQPPAPPSGGKDMPQPVTLDDLKKLNGKSVEVKGILEKDGALLVLEIAAK